MQIAFVVYGQPQPAGSKSAFVPIDKRTGQPYRGKTGRVVRNVVDANPKSRSWKNEIAHAARNAYDVELLRGPIEACFWFFRPRPKGHFKKNGDLSKEGLDKPHPTGKPDVLKLSRAVEDGLIGILYADDSQIVHEEISKAWGEPARVEILIQTVENTGELSIEPIGATA